MVPLHWRHGSSAFLFFSYVLVKVLALCKQPLLIKALRLRPMLPGAPGAFVAAIAYGSAIGFK